MSRTPSVNEPLFKKAIRNYMKNSQKSGNQIYADLVKNNKTYGYSRSTFYRYLEDMGYERATDGHYYVRPGETDYFYDLITQRKYNAKLYFQVETPALTSYLANILNDFYKDSEEVFHCVAIQDILICFYKKKISKKNNTKNNKSQNMENSENTLTSAQIKANIKKIFEKYILQTPCINSQMM